MVRMVWSSWGRVPDAELLEGGEKRLDGVGLVEVAGEIVGTELGSLLVFGFGDAVGEKKDAVAHLELEGNGMKAHEAEKADGRVAFGDGLHLSAGAHDEGRNMAAIDELDLAVAE